MLRELQDVPPAIQLLSNEVSLCKTWIDARKRVKSILPELKAQAKFSQIASLEYIKSHRHPEQFDVHLHGALDILSGDGCMAFTCRIKAADRISRSVGLIADRLWLTDSISHTLKYFGRITNSKIDGLIEDAMIIARLGPLINSGLVRFRAPYYATCEMCAQKITGDISSTAEHIRRVFRKDFRIENRVEGGYLAHTGKCFDPPLMMSDPYDPVPPDINEFMDARIKQELQTIFSTAQEASLTGGSVFSNSRLGLAGLLHREDRLLNKKSLLLLEKSREVSIPWVSELTPTQIIELREEASNALPAFRSQLTKIFALDTENGKSNSNSAQDLIDLLKDQAEDVKAELEAKRKYSAKYWKVTYGMLGLGLSAYGLASDNIAASVGGLLPLIQLFINHKTGYEADIEKLTTRPGYVLLKARDILAHAH